MPNQCLNCKKPLPKGVQSSFCSRDCWLQYKDNRGLAIRPERQATIMLKDSSKNLISSLKSELEKKDEIIRHQDSLIHEYRDSLEAREKDSLRLQAKVRYFEGVVTELRQQIVILAESDSKGQNRPAQALASPASGIGYEKRDNQPERSQQLNSDHNIQEFMHPSHAEPPDKTPKSSFWRRLIQRLKYS
jgi:hypothetical protein